MGACIPYNSDLKWVGDIYRFFSGKPAIFNLESLEPARLLSIRYEDFEKACEQIPKFETYWRKTIQNGYMGSLLRIAKGFSEDAEHRYLSLIGHGHPINALLDNNFTQALTCLGERLEKPKAIMVISAHWQTKGTFVSTNPQPEANYDFKGLDERLFQIKYQPKGCPEIAKDVVKSVRNSQIQETQTMFADIVCLRSCGRKRRRPISF